MANYLIFTNSKKYPRKNNENIIFDGKNNKSNFVKFLISQKKKEIALESNGKKISCDGNKCVVLGNNEDYNDACPNGICENKSVSLKVKLYKLSCFIIIKFLIFILMILNLINI